MENTAEYLCFRCEHLISTALDWKQRLIDEERFERGDVAERRRDELFDIGYAIRKRWNAERETLWATSRRERLNLTREELLERRGLIADLEQQVRNVLRQHLPHHRLLFVEEAKQARDLEIETTHRVEWRNILDTFLLAQTRARTVVEEAESASFRQLIEAKHTVQRRAMRKVEELERQRCVDMFLNYLSILSELGDCVCSEDAERARHARDDAIRRANMKKSEREGADYVAWTAKVLQGDDL